MNICHLYPKKGQGSYVGKLPASNVLIGPGSLNKSNGNTVYRGVGEKVLGLKGLPVDAAKLRRLIIEVADLEGLSELNFTPRKKKLSVFQTRGDFTLADVLLSEVERLNLGDVFVDEVDDYIGLKYFEATDAFKSILTGTFKTSQEVSEVWDMVNAWG